MGGGSENSNLLTVLVGNFDVVAWPVVSLVFPLYASIRAIESKSPVDDQQWLTYWVLYSMISLFELTFSKVIELFPFWSYAKLIFTCWLVMPQFSGASYVYEQFVRPYIVTREKSVKKWYVPSWKKDAYKHDDILTAAEKYIHDHGSHSSTKKTTHHKEQNGNSHQDRFTEHRSSAHAANNSGGHNMKWVPRSFTRFLNQSRNS